MKKLLYYLLLLQSFSLYGQMTTVVPNVAVFCMHSIDSSLYYVHFGNNDTIIQLNTQTGISSPLNVNYNPEVIWDFAIQDSLVFTTSTFNQYRITQYNLNQPSAAPKILVDGFVNVLSIIWHNSEIYFTTYPQNSATNGSVYKINPNETNPTPELVITGLSGPQDLAIRNNNLYILETFGYKISKVNLNNLPYQLENVANVSPGATRMTINDNFVYVANASVDKIESIDLDVPNSFLYTAVEISDPYACAFIGETLYISELAEVNIVKTENFTALSSSENRNFSLFPNPTNKGFRINSDFNFANTRVTISTADGKIIETKQYDYFQSEDFDLPSESGAYVVRIQSTDGNWMYTVLKN